MTVNGSIRVTGKETAAALSTITTGTTTTIGTTTTEVMNMITTMTDTVITTTTIDSTRRCNCSVALAEPVLRFQKRGLELSLSG
jgi:hypothetical protein